jgi:hypothetical protein
MSIWGNNLPAEISFNKTHVLSDKELPYLITKKYKEGKGNRQGKFKERQGMSTEQFMRQGIINNNRQQYQFRSDTCQDQSI